MNIRLATVGDLPWLRLFFVNLTAEQQAAHPIAYPQTGPDDADAFVRSMYKGLDRPRICIAVADVDGQPVGFLAAEVLEREIGLPRLFGHAHYLYVLPAHRKHGVAAALMAFAGAFGIEHGAAFVECYGLAGDDSWARRGFQPLLTRYYRPLTEVAAQSVAVMQAPVAAPTPPKRKRGRPRKQVVNGVDAEVADAAR